MKKYLMLFLASFFVGATLFGQTVSTVPAPIMAAGSAKIVLNQSTGSDYYIWTWATSGGVDYAAFADWNAGISASTKFVSEGASVFTFSIASLKSLYNLTDAQLLAVTQIGVLVRKADGTKLTPNNIFLPVIQAQVQQYSGGDGVIASPYIIVNAADLSKLSTTSAHWGMAFKVTSAIAATNVTATIGNSSTPFTGAFDGGSFEISGSALSGSNDVGFFGVIDGATITNVSLKSVSITATGNGVGGLIGSAKGACNVSNCMVTGAVASDGGGVGGFVGQFSGGSLSSNVARVAVASKYGSAVGGFVGLASGATSNIVDCYATSTVTSVSSTAVGGFIGKVDAGAKIINCYATGNVEAGNEFVGGFVGANYSTVQNSFATTATITSSGKYVGQFGGNNNGENISTGNLVWDGVVPAAGLFSGFGDGGTAKTSSYFNSQNTMGALGFSFSASKWRWDAGFFPAISTVGAQTYPYPFSVSTSLTLPAVQADIYAYPTFVVDNLTLVGINVVGARVIDLFGATVFETPDLDGSQLENKISLTQLKAGIYVLNVYTVNGATTSIKIIKKG